jgi:hypothetical protein
MNGKKTMPTTKPVNGSPAPNPSGRNSQFMQGTRSIFPHPNVDDQLKFAQLLKILGTPTWEGGAR